MIDLFTSVHTYTEGALHNNDNAGIDSTVQLWHLPLPTGGNGGGPTTDEEHAAAAEAARKPIDPSVHLNLSLPKETSQLGRAAKGHARRVHTLEWHPIESEEDEARALVVDAKGAAQFKLPTVAPSPEGSVSTADSACSASDVSATSSIDAPAGREFSCGTWDPHHARLSVFAVGSAVQQWDTRAKSLSTMIASAGTDGLGLCSISYNPNRPWYVSTGGEDGEVRIWDLRAASSSSSSSSSTAASAGGGGDGGGEGSRTGPAGSLPRALVLRMAGHAHAATTCAYNPCHDQLIASGSDDGTVNMWRASSVSSLPIYDDIVQQEEARLDAEGGDGEGPLDDDARRGTRMAPDALLKRGKGHKDSVTRTCWSAYNPWVLVSASWDGRVVFTAVPAKEKMRVLL